MQLFERIGARLGVAPLLVAAALGGVAIAREMLSPSAPPPSIELERQPSDVTGVPILEARPEERVPERTPPSACENPPEFQCGYAASEWFRRNGCAGW